MSTIIMSDYIVIVTRNKKYTWSLQLWKFRFSSWSRKQGTLFSQYHNALQFMSWKSYYFYIFSLLYVGNNMNCVIIFIKNMLDRDHNLKQGSPINYRWFLWLHTNIVFQHVKPFVLPDLIGQASADITFIVRAWIIMSMWEIVILRDRNLKAWSGDLSIEIVAQSGSISFGTW